MATVQAMELPNGRFVIIFCGLSVEDFTLEEVQRLRDDTEAASVMVFADDIEVKR